VIGNLDKYFAVFLAALVVTYLLTPLVRSLALRVGAVDLPNERRPHKRPTARGGGLAVVFGVHAACLVGVALFGPDPLLGLDVRWWKQFALASMVLLVVGIIDDTRGLQPIPKLAGQIVAAFLVSLSGVRFGTLFGHPLPWLVDTAVVVLWIVAVINAFNLIDGLDGLAAGLAGISAAGLCGVLIVEDKAVGIVLLLGLIGACLAFLRYNFHPATIFLGDTGSMFLGFTLGVVSLQTLTKSTFILSMGIPMLVLGIPLFDSLLAIWRRSMRLYLNKDGAGNPGKRSGIMQPDLDHLHHRLLAAGFTTSRVATSLYILNLGLVAFGLLAVTFKSRAAGLLMLAMLFGVYLILRHVAHIELRDTGRAILGGIKRPSYSALTSVAYQGWDIAVLAAALAFAMHLLEPARPDFWRAWFLDLPLWVTPSFSLLALSRTYLTTWTRVRGLDVLMLVTYLAGGLVLSLGLALLIDPAQTRLWLLRGLLVGALSHPLILIVRLYYRAAEEIFMYFRNRGDRRVASTRILLYGAGARCQLFLKDRGFSAQRSQERSVIIGLVDDDPKLHGRWVYGYPVLGGACELSSLITRHRPTDIIVVATLREDCCSMLHQLALQSGVQLSEWFVSNRLLRGGEPISAAAASQQEPRPESATVRESGTKVALATEPIP